jgi:hypothetical protein
MLISGVDWQPTPAKLRRFERQARIAREWFETHKPPDAPTLPIGYDERERLKGTGLLPHMIAWYARSLTARDYNFLDHPSFDDYACGVMASEAHAPDFIRNDEEMRRRFPPRLLNGLGPRLCWNPPKLQRVRPKVWQRRTKARQVKRATSRNAPARHFTRVSARRMRQRH